MLGLFLLPFTLALFQASCVQYNNSFISENQINGTLESYHGLNYEDEYNFQYYNTYEYDAAYDFNNTLPTYFSVDDRFYPLQMTYNGETPQWSIDTSSPRDAVTLNNFRLTRSPTDSNNIYFRVDTALHDENDYYMTNYTCKVDYTITFSYNAPDYTELYSKRVRFDYDEYLNPHLVSSTNEPTSIGKYSVLNDIYVYSVLSIPLSTLQVTNEVYLNLVVSYTYYVRPLSFDQYRLLDTPYIDYDSGYDAGYSVGFNKGYDYAFVQFDQYIANASDASYANGYTTGYREGYSEGVSQDDTAVAIFNGILSIGILPIEVFMSFLNWEVFGINISGFVSATLSVCMLIIVFRFIFKNKVSD